MREEYLDAIAELEEALSPFHLESDGQWTNYEFNTSTIRLSIEALEKQVAKKPIEEEKQYSEDYGFNGDILCPVCNNYIGYYTEAMCKPEYMQYCNECGQRIDDDWSDE